MIAIKELVTAKYPDIFSNGCVAHGLNFMMGDFQNINTVRNIHAKATHVTKTQKPISSQKGILS